MKNKVRIKTKTDCFAYHNGYCSALREMVCAEQNCSFYKTEEQLKRERDDIQNKRKDYWKKQTEVHKARESVHA